MDRSRVEDIDLYIVGAGICFESKMTNGDVIRQSGNRAIAEFVDKAWKCPCEFCVYAKYIEDYGFGEGGFDCKKPDEKDCVDGFEAWLNAPAESEREDG